MGRRPRSNLAAWWTAIAVACLVLPGSLTSQTTASGTEVRFPVSDSLTLVADVHRGPAGPAGPTILLFHQGGGSARGEYRTITPRLLRDGYNVVAADVRGGGDRFGSPSRAAPTDSSFMYCAAAAEVEAALTLARVQGFTGPLVLWGSSYTAALVLQVAARRSAAVAAVLAFSPASGEPMRGCEPAPYVGWLRRAGVPTMVLRPRVELADSGRRAGLEAMRRDGATVVVAARGVHGSSMLDEARTKASTDVEWSAVRTFLRDALRSRAPAPGERRVTIPSDGWSLRGELRTPRSGQGPLVILLHKAAGSRTIYRELAARLAESGIGSLRVDLRGHGESVSRGRFVPGYSDSLIEGTARDIAAILRFARGLPEADTARLGLVSGSYSSEAAAAAMRETGFSRAHVALSPGNFSDESFRAAEASGASWLFARSDDERFVRDWLDAKVHGLAPSAELWVVGAGPAHATDLLAADSAMAGRVAGWLAERLGSLSPRVRYLANEGVLLEGSRGRVLMDALFGDGLPDYQTVPPASRDSLERAVGPYGGPVVVLFTHSHRDHFDSAAVARYRRHNPAATVIGPPAQGAAPLAPVDLGWVQVRALGIPHGHTIRPVGHAAYLVTLDGNTALHLGDTSSDPATWQAAGVPDAGVDLALVPYWYALDERRFAETMAVLQAKRVVLFHPALDAVKGDWVAASRKLRERYPQVRAPVEPGKVVD